MGDRANIVIRLEMAEVSVYSHASGSMLPFVLRDAVRQMLSDMVFTLDDALLVVTEVARTSGVDVKVYDRPLDANHPNLYLDMAGDGPDSIVIGDNHDWWYTASEFAGLEDRLVPRP